MKTHKFIVTVPAGNVSERDWLDYIRAAVKDWRGALHPEDYIFKVDRKLISVRPKKRKK